MNTKQPVTFEQTTRGFVGYAMIGRKKVCVNFVRQEESGLYSLRASLDNGRSFRLIPRVDCTTDASCYYETAAQAMEGANL